MPLPTDVAAILLDMDGVLFHGIRPLRGAAEFLAAIAGIPHCFVTNNPIRSPEAVVEHFRALGLRTPSPDRIVTSAEATARWLSAESPGFRFYAVGAPTLHQVLARVGQADDRTAQFVVVGEGAGLDYDTLTTGINLVLKQGARLVCTNPDHNVDAVIEDRHVVLPGGGALVAPFAAATGCAPVFIGKPHPHLYRMALERIGVGPAQAIMVGDRPDTDIAGAAALGMRTALVRSGRFPTDAVLPSGMTPDWDVADLVALLRAWDMDAGRLADLAPAAKQGSGQFGLR